MTDPTPPPAQQPDGAPHFPAPGQYPTPGQHPATGQYSAGQYQQHQTTGQHPMPGQFQQPPAYPAFGAPPPESPQPRNTVGIIALVAAVIGFIFACLPGALIVGWVLLPIAFILGIVGLFTGPRKGTAIAALIVSIVGTIVGFVVFFTVVTDAVDDAFNSDDPVTMVDPGDKPADQQQDASAAIGSRENPAPLGSTLKAGDWEVTLNSFDPNATQEVLAANSFNDKPAAGNQYGLANLTAKYIGEGSENTMDLTVDYVTSSGNVLKTYDHTAVTPDPTFDGEVYKGASVTGNVDFVIPDGDKGLLRVKMGMFDGKDVYFATR